MQSRHHAKNETVIAAWWLGAALAALIGVLALQHAFSGAPFSADPRSSSPAAAAKSSKPVAPAAAPPALPAAAFVSGVPFSPQAPTGDWSLPFSEACEEASVLMAVSWARGVTELSPAVAAREILDQVAFEDYTFGYNQDTGLAQTLKLFTEHYAHHNAELRYEIRPDDIKRELANGNVVIVPAAGALLANPFYATPPPYHMIVLTGYDDVSGEFIAHDPGTRRGASFRYPYDRLWAAIHDWTGSEETILSGRKGMIVVGR